MRAVQAAAKACRQRGAAAAASPGKHLERGWRINDPDLYIATITVGLTLTLHSLCSEI
jgi:hypothetical protein